MKKFVFVCLLLLMGCRGVDYIETFENEDAWPLAQQDGISAEIINEQLELTVDFPDSLFVTTAGRRNFDDGVIQVEVEPLSGSAESAYGLVFRATPSAEDFYFFLISADGYYSIGGCRDTCDNNNFVRLADNMWTQSDLIRTGLNERHTLRVELTGDNMVFYIDDNLVDSFKNSSFTRGDIGLFVQTFDSPATIAFDNLTFTTVTP